jgi:hypothetical protein
MLTDAPQSMTGRSRCRLEAAEIRRAALTKPAAANGSASSKYMAAMLV